MCFQSIQINGTLIMIYEWYVPNVNKNSLSFEFVNDIIYEILIMFVCWFMSNKQIFTLPL